MALHNYITKRSYELIVPWTSQVTEATLRPFYRDADENLLQPKIPAALYTALDNLLASKPQLWDINDTYSEDDVVLFQDYAYTATAATSAGESPATTPAKWTRLYMWTAWKYVEKYIVLASFEPFATFHGINMGATGMVKVNDPILVSVSDQERARVVAWARTRADVAYNNFFKWLDDLQYVLDGTTYSFNSTGLSSHTDTFNIGTY